jgi:hypothetical protein
MEGYVSCIKTLMSTGMTSEQAAELTMATQKLDTLERMARDGQGKIIFTPSDVSSSLTTSLIGSSSETI